MDEKTAVPQWMVDYIADARVLLGIDEVWSVWVFTSDNLPAGCDATCEPDATYMNARITVASSILGECDYSKRVLTHELLHIVLCELADVAHIAIESVKGKKTRKLLSGIYNKAEEQTIQRITRGMISALKVTNDE